VVGVGDHRRRIASNGQGKARKSALVYGDEVSAVTVDRRAQTIEERRPRILSTRRCVELLNQSEQLIV